jgi:cytochrome P450
MTTTPPPDRPAHANAAGLTPLTATTMCRDPREVFRQLRAVHGNVAPVGLEVATGQFVRVWLVMGYQEMRVLTQEEQLYSRDARNWAAFQQHLVPPDSPVGPMMFFRDNVIGYDGREHRRLRQALDDAVAAIDQRRLRLSVEAMAAQLIDAFADRGEADLITEYAQVIPLLAVTDLFGLRAGSGTSLLAHGYDLLGGLIALFSSGTDSQAGNRRFEQILHNLMLKRRAEPGDDLTNVLLHHPNLRSDSEVVQSMVVLISAGAETTTVWAAQTLRLMLTDPRFAARVRGGRLGVDDALEEVLWRDPPMTNMPARYAMDNVELGGQAISKGDALILGLAGANDDPRVHPHETGIRIGSRAHLAWSAGPHACPARDPARLITRTAVETALHLLPDIALAVPAEVVEPRPSPWTRCPATLPVRFTPSLSHVGRRV